LEETYGITVYQEQVMLLSQKLGGFSKGQADILRKAMGKKDRKTLDKMKGDFIAGATAKGHDAKILEKIWTDWEAFAQYAFNKSHSVCYAFVAYQTGYIKAHYPAQYMAAVLNHAGSIDKITFFMEECKRMGLKVYGPDINESNNGFTVNEQGEIRFGFSGMKGVGENAIENIVEERTKGGKFKDVFDLVRRVNLRAVSKKTLESLIYSGAFDCFEDMHRAQYFFTAPGDVASLDKIVKFGSIFQSQAAGSANTLFGDLQMPDIVPPKLAQCAPWQLVEKLDFEKDVTGMYMSGHPLDDFKFEMTYYGISRLADFNDIKNAVDTTPPSYTFRLAGLVTDGQHRVTKTGKPFGIMHIEDFSGKSDFALFGEDYVKFSNYLDKGTIVMLEGSFKTRYNSEVYQFNISKLHLLETVKRTLTKEVKIDVAPIDINEAFIDFVEDNVKNNPGNTCIKFQIKDMEEGLRISLFSQEKSFTMNDDMAAYLNSRNDLMVSVMTA
jgi:DNA polymerase III subunit alpha